MTWIGRVWRVLTARYLTVAEHERRLDVLRVEAYADLREAQERGYGAHLRAEELGAELARLAAELAEVTAQRDVALDHHGRLEPLVEQLGGPTLDLPPDDFSGSVMPAEWLAAIALGVPAVEAAPKRRALAAGRDGSGRFVKAGSS